MHVPQTLHPSVPYMHTYVVLGIDGVTSGYLSTSSLYSWKENNKKKTNKRGCIRWKKAVLMLMLIVMTSKAS